MEPVRPSNSPSKLPSCKNDRFQHRLAFPRMADFRRKADVQKRRPKRPPKLNGGALHLGRIGAHTAAKNARHRNQYSVTELRVTDALAQHKITLARVLTRILHRPPPPPSVNDRRSNSSPYARCGSNFPDYRSSRSTSNFVAGLRRSATINTPSIASPPPIAIRISK